jgi:hypothetical protein
MNTINNENARLFSAKPPIKLQQKRSNIPSYGGQGVKQPKTGRFGCL